MATVYLLVKVDEPLTPDKQLALEEKLRASYGTQWRAIGNGSYMLAADGNPTTSSVSGAAGITDGGVGAFIVTKMNPYYGWADKSIWEWAASFDE